MGFDRNYVTASSEVFCLRRLITVAITLFPLPSATLLVLVVVSIKLRLFRLGTTSLKIFSVPPRSRHTRVDPGSPSPHGMHASSKES